MTEYTNAELLEPFINQPANRIKLDRYGIFLKTYTMTQEQPAPPDAIDYPRGFPLENVWLKSNPKT